MSTSVKYGGCKDKSLIKCGDKCLDSLFESYICKGCSKVLLVICLYIVMILVYI